jgi:hypothetical protein
MKKFFVFVVVMVLLALVGLGAVYALTYTPPTEPLKVVLTKVKGDVQYQVYESSLWQLATEGTEVKEGDAIKTGGDGQVVINFYDNSVSRLGPNSEMILENSSIKADDPTSEAVGVRLLSGRIWSRVLKLLDQEAGFEVRTADTVATVRGTAFDVIIKSGEETEVAVADNKVEVESVLTFESKDPNKVRPAYKVLERLAKVEAKAGEAVAIKKAEKKAGMVLEAKSLSEEVKNSDWFKNNETEDKSFETEAKARQQKRWEKQAGRILPGTKLYQLKLTAEKIRASLSGSAKDELLRKFDARRAVEIRLLNKVEINKVEAPRTETKLPDGALLPEGLSNLVNDPDYQAYIKKIEEIKPLTDKMQTLIQAGQIEAAAKLSTDSQPRLEELNQLIQKIQAKPEIKAYLEQMQKIEPNTISLPPKL